MAIVVATASNHFQIIGQLDLDGRDRLSFALGILGGNSWMSGCKKFFIIEVS